MLIPGLAPQTTDISRLRRFLKNPVLTLIPNSEIALEFSGVAGEFCCLSLHRSSA